MSDVLDLALVLRNTERAARAAEAALAGFHRLGAELSPRMTALEARFSGLEARIPAMAAGLNSLALDVLKVNDKLLDHDGSFDTIEKRLLDHDGRFDTIERRLDDHTARLARIETTLNAILEKLP